MLNVVQKPVLSVWSPTTFITSLGLLNRVSAHWGTVSFSTPRRNNTTPIRPRVSLSSGPRFPETPRRAESTVSSICRGPDMPAPLDLPANTRRLLVSGATDSYYAFKPNTLQLFDVTPLDGEELAATHSVTNEPFAEQFFALDCLADQTGAYSMRAVLDDVYPADPDLSDNQRTWTFSTVTPAIEATFDGGRPTPRRISVCRAGRCASNTPRGVAAWRVQIAADMPTTSPIMPPVRITRTEPSAT